MEFRLLGPVGMRLDDRELNLGPARQRHLLAALLLSKGKPLPTEALMHRLWDEEPPDWGREVLYTYLSRLRATLREATNVAMLKDARGYRLTVPQLSVDVHRFTGLVAEAGEAGPTDLAVRVSLLREALSLWQGPALDGLSGRWVTRTREQLDRQRMGALLSCYDLELRRGRHREISDELSELVAQFPMTEPLVAQLMLALFRSGRQSEALRIFSDTRDLLIEHHGLEPGPELRRCQRAILTENREWLQPATVATKPQPSPDRQINADAPDDDGHDAATAAPYGSIIEIVRPAQLPPGLKDFVGREVHLRALDTQLSDMATRAVVSIVAGSGGVGKTSLAVHWARRASSHFPDGQLYVNLRGWDPVRPMESADVLRGFLAALGVSPSDVPAEPDGRIGLYRSLLVGRRLLILLDNARDVEQVRPLFPGSPGCMAIVTSRSRLAGLVAADGARSVILDVLDGAEARSLLAGSLGIERVRAEPQTVDEIAVWCAGLPLALAIVAARANSYPGVPLGELMRELRERRSRLDALSTGDTTTDVRTAFSWSYRIVGDQSARLFRRLGLHPGPDIGVAAAASLAGVPVREGRALLAELAQVGLITEDRPGRYAFHDLLRAYAMELIETADDETERRAAQHRMLDYYVHSACAAACTLDRFSAPIAVEPAEPGVTAEEPADADQALAWFAGEHRVLPAVAESAWIRGFQEHAWRLEWALAGLTSRQGHTPAGDPLGT